MLDLWLTTFLDASVKGLALCLLAGVAAFALRRASSAARHLVWRLAVVGLLALPALAVLLPEWRLAVPVPVQPLRETLTAQPVPLALAPSPTLEPAVAPAPSPAPVSEPPAFSFSWREGVLGIWLLGVLVVLAPLGVALLRVRWQGRRARPIQEKEWLLLLDQVRADLGVRRPVQLVEGNEWAMPMTWGWRRPKVLLPAGAEAWPAARRRAVLLHELAHVARGDYLTQLGAEVARALYWFNPLVWRAIRALRLESEHACDDRVLTAGAPAADYAGDLLDIARSLRAGRMAAPAGLAMARPSELTGRLLAVLDTRRNRRSVSRWLALPAWIAAACVVLPLAALTPAAKPQEKARAEKPRLWERFEDLISNQGVQTHEYDDGQNRFKIRIEGKVELTPDWSGITRLDPGAEMRVEEGRGIGRRRVDIRPDAQGRPVYTFWVNGFERPFDAEARQWLKSALLRFIRNSGYEADRRVAGFLKRQGPEGVLAEISQIEGDYGKQVYFEQLFKQAKLSPEILTRTLKQAGQEIDADYHLDETLQAAIRTQELTAASTQAFAEAAAAIEAPYHAERALTALLEHGRLNPASLTAVLRAARGLDSDYHLGELLKRVAGKSVLADPSVRQAYFEAVRAVESDFHRREALTAMVEGGKLGPEALAAVIQATSGIGSDHERASLLVGVAERYSLGGSLRETYLKAAASIGSEYDRNRAEAALGRQRAGR